MVKSPLNFSRIRLKLVHFAFLAVVYELPLGQKLLAFSRRLELSGSASFSESELLVTAFLVSPSLTVSVMPNCENESVVDVLLK